jgi:hypothetical protein
VRLWKKRVRPDFVHRERNFPVDGGVSVSNGQPNMMAVRD